MSMFPIRVPYFQYILELLADIISEHSHGGDPLANQSIEHAMGETYISRQWIPEELGPTDKTAR